MIQPLQHSLVKTGQPSRPMTTAIILLQAALLSLILTACGTGSRDNEVIISVEDQKMLLINKGKPVKTYPVSTSKFGLGSKNGSMCTPLGHMEVAKKIGSGAPSGAVFKSRKPTGEVLRVNAPGRDPIVSRILWLSGKQGGNRNTFSRLIYIHGTPEERHIGYKASYGCIRMKSRDVIHVYRRLAVGSKVHIIRGPLSSNAIANHSYAAQKEGYLPAAGN